MTLEWLPGAENNPIITAIATLELCRRPSPLKLLRRESGKCLAVFHHLGAEVHHHHQNVFGHNVFCCLHKRIIELLNAVDSIKTNEIDCVVTLDARDWRPHRPSTSFERMDAKEFKAKLATDWFYHNTL